jgi:(S)-mandelate dehydrogenase
MVFDYIDGEAGDERCLRRNREAFERIRLQPHHLRDVSRRDLSVDLFGREQSLPLALAPMGLNGTLWPGGDVLLARAAAKAGIPFTLSTASNTTIEEVARQVDGELWFQLYVVQRELAAQLVRRAREAGYRVLMLTVDVAVNGKRERDLRSGFAIPLRYSPRVVLDGVLHPSWALKQLAHGLPKLANFASPDAMDVNAQAALMRRQMDASFAWDDLKSLRDAWPGTMLVKGILSADDAIRCVELGVDGVVLSNHGGRQLDDLRAPIEVLPEVVGKICAPVLLDSGIRRGADVVKALALGARAVLLGRAVLYGLAASGETGAADVLRILRDEIDTTIALLGCPACKAISTIYLADAGRGTSIAQNSAAVSAELGPTLLPNDVQAAPKRAGTG